MNWTPGSWRAFEARQLPHYPDPAVLAAAERELAAYPPLVTPSDTDALREAIADAQAGRAFLLQGGDCAESFAEFSPENIRATFTLFAAMAKAIEAASGLPVIRLGRTAGQFAKPRSSDAETKDGQSLPAYRGDIVNGIAFDGRARQPDPERMFRGYAQSAATLAHLKSLSTAENIRFFTSHEALLLPYEEPLVRSGYATSAHFLWVGDRTRFEGSAHVEFVRGIANPIGIKCGPTVSPDLLLRLLDTLNPERKPGRITLISRMGANNVEEALPPLLTAAAGSGHAVLWSCDPMHGNTIKSQSGYKTRPLDRITSEVRSFFAATAAAGVRAGGIHVEMTGRDVTECTGGAARLSDEDLSDRYHTHCDPRLNAEQAMEVAELVAQILRRASPAGAAAA